MSSNFMEKRYKREVVKAKSSEAKDEKKKACRYIFSRQTLGHKRVAYTLLS